MGRKVGLEGSTVTFLALEGPVDDSSSYYEGARVDEEEATPDVVEKVEEKGNWSEQGQSEVLKGKLVEFGCWFVYVEEREVQEQPKTSEKGE